MSDSHSRAFPEDFRVLWVTEHYPPGQGGMAVSCRRLVRGLRRMEIPVDLVALRRGSRAQVRRRGRDGGWDLEVAVGSHPGHGAQLAYSHVAQEHARRRYHVVVGFGASFAGMVAATYAAWLGTRSVVLVRGNDFDRDWFDPTRGSWTREALRRAWRIGAVAPDQVDRIRSLFPDKHVRWTPNGVDAERWSRLLPGDEARKRAVRARIGPRPVVGVFGFLKFKKRVPFLLRALRRAGLRDEVGLLVVGRMDAETAELLEDPALAPPHTLVLPESKQDELVGLYAACDFMAIPSLYDGMPNVLLEAMAAGVVPIVSSSGGPRSVVEDGVTGFVFGAEDEEDAAQAMRRACSLSDEERTAMARRAHEHVRKHFSEEAERARLVELLTP